MSRIIWSAPARADLRRIDRWLEDNAREGQAIRTLRAIRERVRFLEVFPRGARPLNGGLRVLRVTSTPYLLPYRLNGDGVEIVRVRHEREDW